MITDLSVAYYLCFSVNDIIIFLHNVLQGLTQYLMAFSILG